MLTERSIANVVREGAAELGRASIPTAGIDAQLLLACALKLDRTALLRESQRLLKPKEIRSFRDLLERRLRHEPLAYVTGQKEFWSLEFEVKRSVLIPRPETETLVEAAIEIASTYQGDGTIHILELGTGSGAIAVALAKAVKNCRVRAIDRSGRALAVAKRNAEKHGVMARILFLQGNLFQPVAGCSSFFHLMVSNPPYVATAEIDGLEPEIRLYEPKAALDGGKDGLKFHRWIIKAAPYFLKPGGTLILEIGAEQKEEVARLLADAGSFSGISFRRDLAGNFRVALATLKQKQ